MVGGGWYGVVCWMMRRQPVMVLRREKTRKSDGDDVREEVRLSMTMLTIRRAKGSLRWESIADNRAAPGCLSTYCKADWRAGRKRVSAHSLCASC